MTESEIERFARAMARVQGQLLAEGFDPEEMEEPLVDACRKWFADWPGAVG
jgi:hypothetical protein